MMRGGPINGSGMFGSSAGIIIPTVLQMTTDMLDYWTSMTCLYDPYWEANPEKVTLPICMFHVKKIVPTRTAEASKKRVILYEPQQDPSRDGEEMSRQMRRGIMQTIVDNAVKQPTTYNMEIIVPFQPIGRYVTDGVKIVTDMISAMGDIFGSGFSTFQSVASIAMSALKIAGQAAEFAGKLPSMNGVSYININSLEVMAESCRTLCMKMWTGYDYKYVMITSMTHDKQPYEDDVFRATLTLQEMPVLAVSLPARARAAVVDYNWAVTAISAVQGALVAPLTAITGVKSAVGKDIAVTNTVSNMLGKIPGG